MASVKKKRKTYMKGKSYLKNVLSKGKRLFFFSPSQRRKENIIQEN